MKNKILKILSFSLMILIFGVVNAYDIPNTTRVGTMAIKLTDTEWKVPKENVEFVVTKIGTEQGGTWYLNQRFAETEIDLNKIETTSELDKAAKKIVDFIADENISLAIKDDSTEEIPETKNIPLIKMDETQVKKTDKEGLVVFNDLSVGVYLLYVSDEAEYDHIDPVIISVPTFDENIKEMDYDIEITPKHYPVLKSFKINKVDTETGKTPQGGAKFSGAEFTVYNHKGEITEVLVTDENGYAVSKELYPVNSSVKVVETKAPEGYKINEKPLEFIVNIDDTLNNFEFDDEVRKIDLNINKTNGKNSLNGAVFNVYLTDKNNPEDRSKDKFLGVYISGGISINTEPNTYVLVSNNKEMKNSKEYQTDKQGKLLIPNVEAGTYFIKLKGSDEIKEYNVNKGSFVVEGIVYGETIRLEEIKAPKDYFCAEKDKNDFIKLNTKDDLVNFEKINNKIIIVDTGVGIIQLKTTPQEIIIYTTGCLILVVISIYSIKKIIQRKRKS